MAARRWRGVRRSSPPPRCASGLRVDWARVKARGRPGLAEARRGRGWADRVAGEIRPLAYDRLGSIRASGHIGDAAATRCRGGRTAGPPGRRPAGRALAWRRARWFEGTTANGVAPSGGRPSRHRPQAFDFRRRSRPRLRRAHRRGPSAGTEDCRVALAVWALAFAMRYASSLVDAVRAFDMAAYDDLVSADELIRCTDDVMGTRMGVAQLRAAHALGLGELLVAAGAGDAMCVAPGCTASDAVGESARLRPERPPHRHAGSCWTPTAGVYGQYEGASVHLVGSQRSIDIRQEAAYRELGLEGVTMVASDRRDTGPFVARLHEAYARAGRRSEDERHWLLEPPSWWVPTLHR